MAFLLSSQLQYMKIYTAESIVPAEKNDLGSERVGLKIRI